MAHHIKVLQNGAVPFADLVEVDIRTSINFNVMVLNCCRLTLETESAESEAKEYLLGCVLRNPEEEEEYDPKDSDDWDPRVEQPNMVEGKYKEEVEQDSMIIRCKFDSTTGKFVYDYKATACYIQHEAVQSLGAFPPDGWLVGVQPKDMLIIRNYKLVYKDDIIKPENKIGYVFDPINNNKLKYWQEPLPFFDIDEYPFVMTSGNVSYNSINIVTGQLQAIAYGTSEAGHGQQPFCFMEEDEAWGLHFVTQCVNTN